MDYRRTTRFAVARDGTRVAYHTHEDPTDPRADLARRPTVLLTNGLSTSENFWRHVVHALATEYRVVHWDYRGHGRSERARSGDYSIAAHADDLARVTEAVIAEGDGRTPPVQVGFSMGVAVVVEAYRLRPDLVPAVALLAGPPDAPYATALPLRLPGVLRAVRLALAAATPLVPLAAPLARVVARSRVAYPTGKLLGLLQPAAPREEIEVFLRELAAMDPRAFWDSVRGLMAAHGSEVLPALRVPALVLAAEKDVLVPLAQMAALHVALPEARYVVVRGAGHAGLVEKGPEIAAELRRFLREAAPSGGEPGAPRTNARGGSA